MYIFGRTSNLWCLSLIFVSACTPVFSSLIEHSFLTDWEQIHQTLNTYPLAIDFKDFGRLSQVFADTAVANYTGPLSNLTGLSAIEQGLAASVANLHTQHLLGTTLIDIRRNNTANSTTYFQASLFSANYSTTTTLLGYYLDDLARGTEGWRISRRELVFQRPYP